MNTAKYPRTLHFPWSPGISNDDKVSKDISSLLNIPIVITEKLDGSNTSIDRDNIFARTHAHPPTHPSFDWLKAYHAIIKHKIPKIIQIYGENCYAVHSIKYTELPSYFFVFAVLDLDTNIWSTWDGVEIWANRIGLPTVPVLWKGVIKTEKELKIIVETLASQPSVFGNEREGVVVRVDNCFKNFNKYVMKYVNKDFTRSIKTHWKNKEIIKNGLLK